MRKGIQTDVLRRESRNQYRNHAFFSLQFEGEEGGDDKEGEEGRTFDVEIIDDSDVQLRDTLLHAFRYIVMKNEERKKGNRAHSWDLSTEETISRMRMAWYGTISPSTVSNSGVMKVDVKVDVSGWLQEREKERERGVSTSTVTTVMDEKKIEENFDGFVTGSGMGVRRESATSELSYLTCSEDDSSSRVDGEGGGDEPERASPPVIDGTPFGKQRGGGGERGGEEAGGIIRQKASVSPKRLEELMVGREDATGLELDL